MRSGKMEFWGPISQQTMQYVITGLKATIEVHDGSGWRGQTGNSTGRMSTSTEGRLAGVFKHNGRIWRQWLDGCTLYGSALVSWGKASSPAARWISFDCVSVYGVRYRLACAIASMSFPLSPVLSISIYCCRRNSNSRLNCVWFVREWDWIRDTAIIHVYSTYLALLQRRFVLVTPL